VLIGHVRHIRQGSLLSAAVVITNPNEAWWLASSDLTFRALDRRGKVVAMYQTTVALGPGGSKIAVAPILFLGPNADEFRSIEAVVDPRHWRRGSTFTPTRILVQSARVRVRDGRDTVVTGHVGNHRRRIVRVQISCALWAGRHLAGVGMASVPMLSGRITSRYVVFPQFLRRTPNTADCTADPIV
jgi:hypothetical protein